MTPTVDDFQALARSSPWLWTSLRFRHRTARQQCEAWLTRPDGVRLVDDGGRPIPNSTPGQRPDGSPAGAWSPPEPSYRPDGLVDVRPDFRDDGLFWNDYLWLAMLDPVELSHHVAVSDLHAGEVAGRPAWRASVRALPDYDPMCSCCALIWSAISDAYEFDSPQQRSYPDHYDVALDVQTGVVVRCTPVGGAPDSSWLENDILEVG